GRLHHRTERRSRPRARRGWRASPLLGVWRPWTYDTEKLGAATGKDKEHLDRMMSSGGAVVGGRGTYDAADAWGGTNPWPVPFFIVTHHPEDEPAGKGFTFVNGVEEAILRAREAAGGKNVDIMGGADVIRQAL